MNGTLNVYLHTSLIGHLIQDDHGQTLFEYDPDWLKNPIAVPLSLSLPLQQKTFGEKQCRPFFAGVLPDDAKRRIIARNLGISANNDFAMLEQLGGECAGAVMFLKSGLPMPPSTDDYRPITQDELAAILKELPNRPLMAGEHGVRLSLAGAQDKIAVYKKDDALLLPLNNAPSSHIIKLSIQQYQGMVFNEAFCMRLAQRMNLPVAAVEIGKIGETDYLLIERYDRTITATGSASRLNRIHQEDFCQAMGIVSEWKYQAEGGPSIKQCFDLLRAQSSVPAIDLMSLLNAVIFNFLIGNHDAHGKNFSLLYPMPEGDKQFHAIRLAPLYDLICTAIYPTLSKKMAMKIGKAYELNEVDPDQFEKLAGEIGFARPLVKTKVIDLTKRMLEELDHVELEHPVVSDIKHFIRNHCTAVLDRFTNATKKNKE